MKDSPAPETVFAALAQAIGGASAAQAVQSIAATARCSGPRGAYTTELASLRGDRLQFTQRRAGRPPFTALLIGAQGWAYDPTSAAYEPLDRQGVATVRSHEFQMLPLVMATRYRDLGAGWQQEFAGAECDVVAMTDELGYPCHAYFRQSDHLWAGMSMVDARAPFQAKVQVVVREWRRVGALRLPSAITASDSAGDFRLDFHTITLNTVDPAIFCVPAARVAA